jgi:hypothetical protein
MILKCSTLFPGVSNEPSRPPALTVPADGSYNPRSTDTTSQLTRGVNLIRPNAASILGVPAVLILTALLATGARGETLRTTSADARGATFELTPSPARLDSVTIEGRVYAQVTVPGAAMVEPPGKPALPMLLVPFGVPDGMSPRARIVAEEWTTRPGPPPLPVVDQRYVGDDPATGPESEYRWNPDPLIYAGAALYPAEAVTLAGGAPVGEMWADAARVRPVRWDPRNGTYRVLAHMTLRVDFVPASDRERAARPAFKPASEASIWKRIQQTTLRNYDAARLFPRRPSRAPLPPRAPVRLGQGNPEFKISVTATGWSSVGYAALAAAGFPAGIPIADIGVWERGWDSAGDSATATPIPVVAKDAGTPGVFDAGDAVTFYARNLRDRFGAGSIENRYSYANVYWLSWTASPAAVPDTIPGVIPAPSPELPGYFRDTIHLEQNNYLMASPNSSVGAPSENVEDFFWTKGANPLNQDNPEVFDTPISFLNPDVTQPFRIQARYQGRNGSTHRLSIFHDYGASIDTLALVATFFNQDVYVLDTGFSLPGSHITAGTNHYRHTGDHIAGGSPLPGTFAWLDWVDVTYARQYVAVGNKLAFTTGPATGVAELHVTGFTQSGIRVYDITDPVSPRRVTGVVEAGGGGAFDITFRADASGGTRRFLAFTPGTESTVPASAITADVPSNLSVPTPATTQTRAIMIGPRAFLTPLNRLADYRRGQGYVVDVASIEDVYDEFNGGIKSAAAIRRYTAYANKYWTPRPAFVVLAGDASLDYRKDLAASAADWVPTYLQFEFISGPQGLELVAGDPFYSLDLDSVGGTGAYVPTVFLGRIPASSAAELDAYVSKVIQYEQWQPTDTWRGRQLLVSDDQYSSSIFFNQNYCYQPVEALFRAANQAMADTAAASASGQDIRSDFFDLSTFSDPVPTYTDPFGNTCRSLQAVKNAFAAVNGCYDQLIAQVAQGGLILNVEAHANRYLIAHEEVFCGSSQYCSSPFTTDRIANTGKPFLLMIWGCHANQFPDGPDLGRASVDSTDAIGEQWVLRTNSGAIGALGSSGYELLNTNAAFNNYVAEVLYTQPPAPVLPGQPRLARWIMGEIVGKAMILNAFSGSYLQQSMNHTIHLLGDPMVHMDALPPRVWEVEVDGTPFSDGSALTTDSPTDSLTLVAKVRDEVAIQSTELAERLLPSGTIVPVSPSTYSVAIGDTGRANTLTAHVRPRPSNYDLLVRATDSNGRQKDFTLQVRVTVRYTADGKDLLSGEFVGTSAVLRAEIVTPAPVPADSLELLVDGMPIVVSRIQTDATGRRWTLEGLPESRGPGSHELRIAIGGRSAEFDAATFQVDATFRLLHVAVVSPSIPVVGCDGSVFQYELTAPASRVRLQILTIAGRRVASFSWPGNTGINVQCWDGRDSEGHAVARGVYLYRLTATDGAGKSTTYDGRMLRTR